MEFIIGGIIFLVIVIVICLIVFFCRRNRNDDIVISTGPKIENEEEAHVVDVNKDKNKFKFYDDMMNRLDTLNKKADIAIENDKKTLEDMKKLNIKSEKMLEDSKKLNIKLEEN